MKTDKILKEVEDALVAALKYRLHPDYALLTQARAKTLIADIRAARFEQKKDARLKRFNSVTTYP
jgi:hypothetical protein